MRRKTFTQLYAGKFGAAPVSSKDTYAAAVNSQTFILRGLLLGVFQYCFFYLWSRKWHVLDQSKCKIRAIRAECMQELNKELLPQAGRPVREHGDFTVLVA